MAAMVPQGDQHGVNHLVRNPLPGDVQQANAQDGEKLDGLEPAALATILQGARKPVMYPTYFPVPLKLDPILALVLNRAMEKPPTGIFKFQVEAALLYSHIRVQVFVAGLICANFLTNIAEKQFDPFKDKYRYTWDVFDYGYNMVFLIELILNMFGFWWRPFWSSAWNWFDVLVVSIGVLNMFEAPLPGPLSLLRMMRAFRVFRLFKRVKSLNLIIVSLARAIPGVVNAFLIMLIVMAIYAMLAVQFYQGVGFKDGDIYGVCKDKFLTARGNCYGWEYFGDFIKALYTLFQILTGESWCEAIVRLQLIEDDGFENNFGAALFFVSFFILNSVVLINVIVAVLLDKMAAGHEDHEAPPAEEGGGQDVLHEELPELVNLPAGGGGDVGTPTCEDNVPAGVTLYEIDHQICSIRGDVVTLQRRLTDLDSEMHQQFEEFSGTLAKVLMTLDTSPPIQTHL